MHGQTGRPLRSAFRVAAQLVLLAAIPVAAPAQKQTGEHRKLTAPTVIDGVSCDRTDGKHAEFHPSGRLLGCPLAGDTVIAGHRFPAGTWIYLTDSAALSGAWLSSDTVLDGHLCRGKGYEKWRVSFHPGGHLASCYLAANATIEGIPCIRGTVWTEIRGGIKSVVSFHDNGRLRQCQASRAFVRDGVRIGKWKVVKNDPPG